MMRAIQLNHRSKARLALPPLPVLLAPTPYRPLAGSQQPSPHRIVIHHEPFLLQFLGHQGRTEILIAILSTALQHLHPQHRWFAPQARFTP